MPRLKVLITGAAGRIGRHLCSVFGEAYELRTLDVRPLPERSSHLVGSVEDPETARRAVAEMDVVIHLAANPSPDAPFEKLLGPNIEATAQLFEAAAEAHVRRIVYASSCHAVLGYPADRTIEADDPLRPLTLYGVTKGLGEVFGRYYHDKHGLEFVALRLGYFAAPGHGKGRREDLQRWIGPDDAAQLFRQAIETPCVGFLVVNGLSKTFFPQLGLRSAREQLGYEPRQDVRQAFNVPVDWQGPMAEPSRPASVRRATGGRLKVLITGAAGRVGRYLMEQLRGEWDMLGLDRQYPGDEPGTVRAELTDYAAIRSACEGRDVVIHLAANADNRGRWEHLVAPNVTGAHHVFRAASEAGVRRMVFASSCHTIFAYPTDHVVEVTDPVRPANLYGITKVFGELLGRYYHDQRGMEFVGVRIGTFDTDVHHPFLRSIWLSRDDVVRFFRCAAEVPEVGYTIAFATSKTEPLRVSLKSACERLGYEPQDDVRGVRGR